MAVRQQGSKKDFQEGVSDLEVAGKCLQLDFFWNGQNSKKNTEP